MVFNMAVTSVPAGERPSPVTRAKLVFSDSSLCLLAFCLASPHRSEWQARGRENSFSSRVARSTAEAPVTKDELAREERTFIYLGLHAS